VTTYLLRIGSAAGGGGVVASTLGAAVGAAVAPAVSVDEVPLAVLLLVSPLVLALVLTSIIGGLDAGSLLPFGVSVVITIGAAPVLRLIVGVALAKCRNIVLVNGNGKCDRVNGKGRTSVPLHEATANGRRRTAHMNPLHTLIC
jgi:hypothetical protein